METSVTIIGAIIVALIAIPMYKIFHSNSLNKSKTKAVYALYPQCNFGEPEVQNKKALSLDRQKKGFLMIDFNQKPLQHYFVDLNKIQSCKVVPITDAKFNNVVAIEFEFHSKDGSKEIVPIYSIEYDQITQVCLHEDSELAKKWQKEIATCLSA